WGETSGRAASERKTIGSGLCGGERNRRAEEVGPSSSSSGSWPAWNGRRSPVNLAIVSGPDLRRGANYGLLAHGSE
ncbi:MAG TPA: hypothetical protein VNV87_20130, partial [Acidimicrobiales bacterium]|nr:hypothetical protein [Acidimicrobiales bacterium]